MGSFVKKRLLVLYIALFLVLFFSACSRAPLKHNEDAMRLASAPPALLDQLSKESFLESLKKHIAVMKISGQVQDPMVFGKKSIKKSDYINALEKILEHEEDYLNWISLNFEFHEVYGRDDWSEVMVTGYYEPLVKGSKKESTEFSQALYSTPEDLLTIDLKEFAAKFMKGERLGLLKGRLVNKAIVPYYDRKEIDESGKLKDRRELVLAWVDPLDSFFIQIQGSGVVEFEDGEKMRVGYDSQNGHAYYPIGRFLTDSIPLEKMSMQKIKLHLKTLKKDEQQKVMNKNPSYVFFKKLDSGALTYAGMEVQEGRTIATDFHLFPKGAMGFLETEEPEFNSLNDVEVVSWQSKSRLVFDQDTGGAIRGSGRVDLYLGHGDLAAQKAGVMKQKGRLFYLVPKI